MTHPSDKSRPLCRLSLGYLEVSRGVHRDLGTATSKSGEGIGVAM